jgi:predicted membrane protein
LASVFLYVAGASWMGRIIVQRGEYWRFGGFHNGITFALLVIGIGLLLLCLNGGMLPVAWKCFFISWPMLLFVLGCSALCKIHYVPGIILTSIGTFFLVQRFPGGSFDGQFVSTWWPVFIIIGGGLIFFSILLKPKQFIRARRHKKGCWEDNHFSTQKENSDGAINYKLVFSGMEQVILDPVFKGGIIETVFGGMELDLRLTALREGDTYLYVKTVFGGVDIKAPDSWLIEIRSDSAFGGVTDDRSKSRDFDHSKKLIIVANAVFGGVTIK